MNDDVFHEFPRRLHDSPIEPQYAAFITRTPALAGFPDEDAGHLNAHNWCPLCDHFREVVLRRGTASLDERAADRGRVMELGHTTLQVHPP